jgi:tripeptidyl-peptidase-1
MIYFGFLLVFSVFLPVFSSNLLESTSPKSILDKFHTKLHEFDGFTVPLKFQRKLSANPKNHHKYRAVGKPLADTLHEGIILLKQQNVDKLEELVHSVSNPVSENYGKFLSSDEIRSLTIAENSISHIFSVLRRYGFANLNEDTASSYSGDFIKITEKIEVWEKLLNASFAIYEHSESSDLQVVRCLEYSIPEILHEHVEMIFNTIHFPIRQSNVIGHILSHRISPDLNAVLSSAEETEKADDPTGKGLKPLVHKRVNGYVTPDLLYSYYNIHSPIGNSLASQGVYETIGQTFSPSDLTLFQETFNLTREAMASVIGGHASDQQCIDKPEDCGEANLDVQYLMAVAQKVPSTYYYWAEKDFMIDWMTQVSNMASPPLVFSISYGADERELPVGYSAAFNLISLKLAAKGISITVASGDDGAQSANARSNPLMCGYSPSFPATSPYVTAVGGTMVRVTSFSCPFAFFSCCFFLSSIHVFLLSLLIGPRKFQ